MWKTRRTKPRTDPPTFCKRLVYDRTFDADRECRRVDGYGPDGDLCYQHAKIWEWEQELRRKRSGGSKR